MENKQIIIDLNELDDDKLSKKEYLDILTQIKIKKNISYILSDVKGRVEETIEDMEEDTEYKSFNREYVTALKLFMNKLNTYNTNRIMFRCF